MLLVLSFSLLVSLFVHDVSASTGPVSTNTTFENNPNCPKNFWEWGMTYVDLEKFQGHWYESWTTFKGRNCSFLDFIDCDNDQGYCGVHDHTVLPEDTMDDSYSGIVTVANPRKKGHLSFDFGVFGSFDVFLIDTDYEHCAIAYVCGTSGEYFWIFSRNRDTCDDCLDMADVALSQRGQSLAEFQKEGGRLPGQDLRTGKIYKVPQSQCPKSEPVPRCPPQFRLWGRTVMKLPEIAGTWYEIESTLKNRRNAALIVRDIGETKAEIVLSSVSNNDIGVWENSEQNDGLGYIKLTNLNTTLKLAVVYSDTHYLVAFGCGQFPNHHAEELGSYIGLYSRAKKLDDTQKKELTSRATKYLKRHRVILDELRQPKEKRTGWGVYVDGQLTTVYHD